MSGTREMKVRADDGVSLYVSEAGSGDATILFLHEFASDHRNWRPQMATFADRFRCVAYSARGYVGSDVPAEAGRYSQERAVADALTVLDAFEIALVHLVGLSMGAFTALQLSLAAPRRVESMTLAGFGYGAMPDVTEQYRAECRRIADVIERDPERFTLEYALGPARVQFRDKDPEGHELFTRRLAQQPPVGLANTLRGVQAARPSPFEDEGRLRTHSTPTLILMGDQDMGALDASWHLARTLPFAALGVLPASGHTLNLEEPRLFDWMLQAFLAEEPDGFRRYRPPSRGGRTGLPVIGEAAGSN